jgi:S1-C subfamily serine protease
MRHKTVPVLLVLLLAAGLPSGSALAITPGLPSDQKEIEYETNPFTLFGGIRNLTTPPTKPLPPNTQSQFTTLATPKSFTQTYNSQQSAAPLTSTATPQITLTTREIAMLADRAVMIELFNDNDELVGLASGFLVRSDGKIITSYRAITQATKAKVTLHNQTTYSTDQVLLTDAKHDLALLKITAKSLPKARLGDSSKLQLGDPIVAIGSQPGLPNSLSAGIISGIRRSSNAELPPQADSGTNTPSLNNAPSAAPLLQTTAPSAPSYLGGPLFNLSGEVIGMTTTPPPGSNLHFVIPSNQIKSFLEQSEQPTTMSALYAPADQPKDKTDTWAALIERLQSEHSTYEHPATGESIPVEFTIRSSNATDDTQTPASPSIAVTIRSAEHYKSLLEDFKAGNSVTVSALLQKIALDLLNADLEQPTLTLYATFTTRKLDKQYPSSDIRYLASQGMYQVDHPFAWASLNSMTGDLTYCIEPAYNDVEHTVNLLQSDSTEQDPQAPQDPQADSSPQTEDTPPLEAVSTD